jgi:hypothetical protein
MKMETVVTTGKWAVLLNHLKENRIEYLLATAFLHILGVTTTLYSQVEGVCI